MKTIQAIRLLGLLMPIGIGLASAAILFHTLTASDPSVPGGDVGTAAETPSLDHTRQDFSLAPIADYAAITERPVFSPTRRPAPVPTSEEEPTVEPVMEDEPSPPPPPPDLDASVAGIVLSTARRIALFRIPTQDRLVPVGEGDELLGWTVVTIEPRTVLLRHGDTQKEVELIFRPSLPVGRNP